MDDALVHVDKDRHDVLMGDLDGVGCSVGMCFEPAGTIAQQRIGTLLIAIPLCRGHAVELDGPPPVIEWWDAGV